MKQKHLLAAILGVLSPLASAADNEIPGEIVVTATRVEQPLNKTLSSTTVITQEDIKKSQAADVATILRSVAGVEISQNGGMGKPATIFMRGSNSTQVLVLLDGVRISSATSGTTAIEHLMLDQVERIEVVRGNVSSLYGSDAIGGVIQIFTKRAHTSSAFNVSEGVGSHGTQRLSTGWGGVVENTSFNIQLSRFQTDGVSALDPTLYSRANPDKDGYDNTSVSANVRHAFSDDHSLSASLFNSQGRNQFDSGYSPSVATDTHESDVKVSKFSLVSDNRLSQSWKSQFKLAQGVDSSQSFTNGAPQTPGSIYKTTSQQVSWQNTLDMEAGKQLLVGAEYLRQLVTSDLQPAYNKDERRVSSLFAGYTGNYGAHQLQTNLRQDNDSQYGIANTGLLGYGYAFNEAWRATTSYSTAFRAPTFNQLYYPNYGNANLKPEKSQDTEVGLHYAENGQYVDFVWFDNRTSDLISGSPLKNIKESRVDGLELSYKGQFGDTGLKVSAVTQNPRDLSTGAVLDRRANQHGSVVVTQQLNALQLGVEWLYSDARVDSTRVLEAYSVLNLTAGYALSKELRLSLRADNVTNQNDSNAYGYNPLGRTFFVSMSYQQ